MVKFLSRVVDSSSGAVQVVLEAVLRKAFAACNELLPFSSDNLEVGYILLIVKAIAGDRGVQLVRSRLRAESFSGSQSASVSNHDVLMLQDFLDVCKVRF